MEVMIVTRTPLPPQVQKTITVNLRAMNCRTTFAQGEPEFRVTAECSQRDKAVEVSRWLLEYYWELLEEIPLVAR